MTIKASIFISLLLLFHPLYTSNFSINTTLFLFQMHNKYGVPIMGTVRLPIL